MIPWILATGVLYPKTMSWPKPGSFACHWINLSPCFQKFAGTDSSKESPKLKAPQFCRAIFFTRKLEFDQLMPGNHWPGRNACSPKILDALPEGLDGVLSK